MPDVWAETMTMDIKIMSNRFDAQRNIEIRNRARELDAGLAARRSDDTPSQPLTVPSNAFGRLDELAAQAVDRALGQSADAKKTQQREAAAAAEIDSANMLIRSISQIVNGLVEEGEPRITDDDISAAISNDPSLNEMARNWQTSPAEYRGMMAHRIKDEITAMLEARNKELAKVYMFTYLLDDEGYVVNKAVKWGIRGRDSHADAGGDNPSVIKANKYKILTIKQTGFINQRKALDLLGAREAWPAMGGDWLQLKYRPMRVQKNGDTVDSYEYLGLPLDQTPVAITVLCVDDDLNVLGLKVTDTANIGTLHAGHISTGCRKAVGASQYVVWRQAYGCRKLAEDHSKRLPKKVTKRQICEIKDIV
ncbi:hypothetical protein N9N82_03085 [Luminiphilus sp.]|nr:hypothetical protein [Luminiphilus sp.]